MRALQGAMLASAVLFSIHKTGYAQVAAQSEIIASPPSYVPDSETIENTALALARIVAGKVRHTDWNGEFTSKQLDQLKGKTNLTLDQIYVIVRTDRFAELWENIKKTTRANRRINVRFSKDLEKRITEATGKEPEAPPVPPPLTWQKAFDKDTQFHTFSALARQNDFHAVRRSLPETLVKNPVFYKALRFLYVLQHSAFMTPSKIKFRLIQLTLISNNDEVLDLVRWFAQSPEWHELLKLFDDFCKQKNIQNLASERFTFLQTQSSDSRTTEWIRPVKKPHVIQQWPTWQSVEKHPSLKKKIFRALAAGFSDEDKNNSDHFIQRHSLGALKTQLILLRLIYLNQISEKDPLSEDTVPRENQKFGIFVSDIAYNREEMGLTKALAIANTEDFKKIAEGFREYLRAHPKKTMLVYFAVDKLREPIVRFLWEKITVGGNGRATPEELHDYLKTSSVYEIMNAVCDPLFRAAVDQMNAQLMPLGLPKAGIEITDEHKETVIEAVKNLRIRRIDIGSKQIVSIAGQISSTGNSYPPSFIGLVLNEPDVQKRLKHPRGTAQHNKPLEAQKQEIKIGNPIATDRLKYLVNALQTENIFLHWIREERWFMNPAHEQMDGDLFTTAVQTSPEPLTFKDRITLNLPMNEKGEIDLDVFLKCLVKIYLIKIDHLPRGAGETERFLNNPKLKPHFDAMAQIIAEKFASKNNFIALLGDLEQSPATIVSTMNDGPRSEKLEKIFWSRISDAMVNRETPKEHLKGGQPSQLNSEVTAEAALSDLIETNGKEFREVVKEFQRLADGKTGRKKPVKVTVQVVSPNEMSEGATGSTRLIRHDDHWEVQIRVTESKPGFVKRSLLAGEEKTHLLQILRNLKGYYNDAAMPEKTATDLFKALQNGDFSDSDLKTYLRNVRREIEAKENALKLLKNLPDDAKQVLELKQKIFALHAVAILLEQRIENMPRTKPVREKPDFSNSDLAVELLKFFKQYGITVTLEQQIQNPPQTRPAQKKPAPSPAPEILKQYPRFLMVYGPYEAAKLIYQCQTGRIQCDQVLPMLAAAIIRPEAVASFYGFVSINHVSDKAVEKVFGEIKLTPGSLLSKTLARKILQASVGMGLASIAMEAAVTPAVLTLWQESYDGLSERDFRAAAEMMAHAFENMDMLRIGLRTFGFVTGSVLGSLVPLPGSGLLAGLALQDLAALLETPIRDGIDQADLLAGKALVKDALSMENLAVLPSETRSAVFDLKQALKFFSPAVMQAGRMSGSTPPTVTAKGETENLFQLYRRLRMKDYAELVRLQDELENLAQGRLSGVLTRLLEQTKAADPEGRVRVSMGEGEKASLIAAYAGSLVGKMGDRRASIQKNIEEELSFVRQEVKNGRELAAEIAAEIRWASEDAKRSASIEKETEVALYLAAIDPHQIRKDEEKYEHPLYGLMSGELRQLAFEPVMIQASIQETEKLLPGIEALLQKVLRAPGGTGLLVKENDLRTERIQNLLQQLLIDQSRYAVDPDAKETDELQWHLAYCHAAVSKAKRGNERAEMFRKNIAAWNEPAQTDHPVAKGPRIEGAPMPISRPQLTSQWTACRDEYRRLGLQSSEAAELHQEISTLRNALVQDEQRLYQALNR